MSTPPGSLRSLWWPGDRFSDLERPSPLNALARTSRMRAAIIGGGQTRDAAPYGDPAWQVWCCNALRCLDAEGRFRADRWFELHPLPIQSEEDEAWLKVCPVPIYMIEAIPAVPRSLRYPREQAQVLAPHPNFFGSTFAFQVALALLEGFQEIGLWGVDLAVGWEALVERPCLLWWLGLAAGRGVRITVPPESTLLSLPHLYGYDGIWLDEDESQGQDEPT